MDGAPSATSSTALIQSGGAVVIVMRPARLRILPLRALSMSHAEMVSISFSRMSATRRWHSAASAPAEVLEPCHTAQMYDCFSKCVFIIIIISPLLLHSFFSMMNTL